MRLRHPAIWLAGTLLLALLPQQVHADCSGDTVGPPNVEGSAGNDTIECDDAAAPVAAVSISALGGNDFVRLSGGFAVSGDITGGSGNDDLILRDTSSVGGNVVGGSGDDNLVLFSPGATVTGNFQGGSNNDRLNVTAGSVANLLGESGDDDLSIDGGTVTGVADGGTGNDDFVGTGGSVTSVIGGDGDDVLDLLGTTVNGNVTGDADDDIVALGASLVTGFIDLGTGSDGFTLFPGFTGTFPTSIDGGDDSSVADGDIDTAFYFLYTGLAGPIVNFEHVQLDDTLNVGAQVTFDAASYTTAETGSGFGLAVDPFSVAIFDNPGLTWNGDVFIQGLLRAEEGGVGNKTITGVLENSGRVTLADAAPGDRLAVGGDYRFGAAAVLEFDAVLAGSGSPADLLDVDGSVVPLVGGTSTTVLVTNVGGTGALTGNGPGNGIPLIDVSATGNTAAGDFVLPAPILVNGFQYDLDLESDAVWYLQSRFRDTPYPPLPAALQAMQRDYVGTLWERVGERAQNWTGGATQVGDGWGPWLRGGGFFGETDLDGGTRPFDQDHFYLQLGLDAPLSLGDDGGRLIGTVTGHVGWSDISLDAPGNVLAAEADITAYGGGASLTWHSSFGLVLDAVAAASLFDIDTTTYDTGGEGETDGWGLSLGLEALYAIPLGSVHVTPQLQLVWTHLSFDDFTDSAGTTVELGEGQSLEGRLGVAVDSGKLWRSGNAYIEANLIQEFLGDYEVSVAGTNTPAGIGGTGAEVGFGGTVSLADNVRLYGEVDYRFAFDDGRTGVQANLGVQVGF